jgi:hypothetical protein
LTVRRAHLEAAGTLSRQPLRRPAWGRPRRISKRLKGLEPSTFCMASRDGDTRVSALCPAISSFRPWSRVSDGSGQFPLVSASFGRRDRLVCPFSPVRVLARPRTHQPGYLCLRRCLSRPRGGREAGFFERLAYSRPVPHVQPHRASRRSLRSLAVHRTLIAPKADRSALEPGTPRFQSGTMRTSTVDCGGFVIRVTAPVPMASNVSCACWP